MKYQISKTHIKNQKKQNLKNKFLNFSISQFLSTIYYLLITFASPVFAAPPTNLKKSLDLNFFQVEIDVFLSKAIDAAIIIGALLCLGYLLWGGIDWLISEGDKAKYETARNKILHAIVGLAIIASVWVIWKLILQFLGLGEAIQID